MSNRSLIILHLGDKPITAIANRWGANAYGLASQISTLASAMYEIHNADKITIKNEDWIHRVVKIFERLQKDGSYVLPIPESDQDFCSHIDLDLANDGFSPASILDVMEICELEEDEDFEGSYDSLPHLPEWTEYLKWNECIGLVDKFMELEKTSEYYRSKEDNENVFFFSED